MSVLVSLKNVSKMYGEFTAIHPTTLDIHAKEFLAILGPSGCGKTTLLRTIGGFVRPSSGTVELAGQDVTHLGPEKRPTNMVFQGYGLFPHMTVAQNVAYGLRLRKIAESERADRVQEALDLVHLSDFGPRRIDQMSGGQRQRIALARALVMRPKVLLLDEPLSALDLKLRQAMQDEFRRIHAATGGTFVFVTHDQSEAMGLANRICVMENGRIIQDGAPEDIYCHPKTRFISTFIGEANLFAGRRAGNNIRLRNGITFPDLGKDEDVVCVIRPEKVRLKREDKETIDGCDVLVRATVIDVVFLGSSVQYSLENEAGERIRSNSRDMDQRRHINPGDRVLAGWQRADQVVLSDK